MLLLGIKKYNFGSIKFKLHNMKIQFLVIAFLIASLGSSAKGLNEQLAQQYAQKKARLSFIENKGQITDQNQEPRSDIQFQLKAANGLTVFIGNGSIHYQFAKVDRKTPNQKLSPSFLDEHEMATSTLTYDLYRMDVSLIGANTNAKVLVEGKQDYLEQYHSAATKATNTTVNAYERITYKDIYPNIDWVLYLNDGKLKHEFVVRTGGKVEQIQLKYGGAAQLNIKQDGSLEAITPLGAITEKAPVSYTSQGQKVESKFKLSNEVLRYEVGSYKGTLVIDPNLVWSTYFGGNDGDYFSGLSTDASGNVVVSGYTSSVNNIASTGAYQTTFSGYIDAFIAKFNSAGVRQWSSYYGGVNYEDVYGMKVDASGNIYLTGATQSYTSIATTGAFKTTMSGNSDAFLAKFSPTGSLVWGTYYGGSADDNGRAVAFDMLGNVLLVGATNSVNGANDIATTGAHQVSFNGGSYDMMIVKFSTSGTRLWGTFYGGNNYDVALGVATDANNNVFVTGWTGSTTNIASFNGFQTTLGGTFDAVLIKLNSNGARQWATYMGGSSSEGGSSVAVGVSGNIYITGTTSSSNNIASVGSYQSLSAGGADGYLSKFSTTGARLWSTYTGGSNDDVCRSVALDSAENVYISGNTLSTTLIATPNSYQTTYAGGNMDGMLLKYNSSGIKQWGTYFGGPTEEEASNVAVDFAGNIYISGYTNSTSGIATTNAYQSTFGAGLNDGFLAKFDCVLPEASLITGLGSVCVGSTIALSDSVSGGVWLTMNPSIATINTNGIVTGMAAGTTTILYVLSNTCGSDTVSKLITVNPLPTLNGGIDQAVCQGSSVLLNALSNASLSWNNGVQNNLSFIPTATSNYIVTATNQWGCAIKDTVTVTVNPLPTIFAGNDTTVCAASSIALNATSNATLTWSGGVVNNQFFTVNTTNAYVATATTAQGCVAKDTVVVTVQSAPSLNAGNDQNVCLGNSVILNAVSNGTIIWNNGITNNQAFTPSSSNYYVATATNAVGCAAKDTVYIGVSAYPNATIVAAQTTICNNGNTTITANGGDTYVWNNGDTSSTTTIYQAGNYFVIATNQYGCSDTSNMITIVQKAMPSMVKVKVDGSSTVCEPNVVNYILDMPLGSTTGFAYQWFTAGAPIVGATDSVFSATSSGSYSILISGGSTCNKISAPKTAVVKPLPIASFTALGNTTICAGDLVSMVAPTITGYTYTWLKDGVAVGGGTTKSFKLAGNYSIVAKLNGCIDTSDNSIQVVVNPLPVATITAATNANLCMGDSCTLAALPSNALSFEWRRGNNLSGITTVPTYKVGEAATFKVMVTDSNGCTSKLSTTSVKVKVTANPIAVINAASSTTIAANGTVKLKASPTMGEFYQWYLNGNPIIGATNQFYIANQGGNYTVLITKNGCTSISPSIAVTQLGVKEAVALTSSNDWHMTAYPNPTSNYIQLAIEGIENIKATVQVMDFNGRVVAMKEMTTSSTTVDMTGFASGVYLIRYKDAEGRTGAIKINKQ